jgi:O-antigen ligase
MNLYEVLNPLTWSSVRGRSAGTFVNPNLSALAILSLAALLATLARRGLVVGLVLAAAGVGVLATFSRSGAAVWVCLTGYFLFGSGRFAMRKRFAVLGLTIAGIVALFVLLPDEILEIPNVSQRLRLLEGRGFGDFSTDERAEVIRRGFARVQEAPLAGHGPGAGTRIQMANGVLGAHNEYLSTWVSHGLIGLLIWCAFLLRVGRRRAAGLAILLALVSLSFHSLLLKRQLLVVMVAFEALVPLRCGAHERAEEAPVLQPATGIR